MMLSSLKNGDPCAIGAVIAGGVQDLSDEVKTYRRFATKVAKSNVIVCIS